MKQTRGISEWMGRLRVDITAILLITFVYQLLTPVIVLAAPVSGEDDFQRMVRDSICRVGVVSDQATEDRKAPPVTDRFVCDLCILCAVDILDRSFVLPDDLFKAPRAGLDPVFSKPFGRPDKRLLCLSEAPARAPPV